MSIPITTICYGVVQCLTLSQTTNFIPFQTVCRRQFKFDENGGKLSKQVENPKGKGENAHYEQFLLFLVFSKDLYYRHVKTRVCSGKG